MLGTPTPQDGLTRHLGLSRVTPSKTSWPDKACVPIAVLSVLLA